MKAALRLKGSAIGQGQCTNGAGEERHSCRSKVQIQRSWAHGWRSTAQESWLMTLLHTVHAPFLNGPNGLSKRTK